MKTGTIVIFLYTVVTIVVFSACGNSNAVIPRQTPGEPVTPEIVQQLFIQRCATCHGSGGHLEIGGAKKLTTSTLSAEDVASQIRNGKGSMPPFRDMLTEEQIVAISEYTVSLRRH